MATIFEKDKKDSDWVSEAQNQAIVTAIDEAFKDSNAQLTEERRTRLKIILNTIVNAQKNKPGAKHRDILNKKAILKINSKLDERNNKLEERNRKLDEIKRKKIIANLNQQDLNVNAVFAVGMSKALEKSASRPITPGAKFASSSAVLVGGSCFGTGISMIIMAGSVAAAGTFPIGLAIVGGAMLFGAGIYYAKKKRERISKFLPALYHKAKNARDLRIAQLDDVERQNKLKILKKKYLEVKKKDVDLHNSMIEEKREKIQPRIDKLDRKILRLKKEGKQSGKSKKAREKLQKLLESFEKKTNTTFAEKKQNAKQEFKKAYHALEKKSAGLKWYKKFVPTVAYWGSCIAINLRSNVVALGEFIACMRTGLLKAREVQDSLSGAGAGANMPVVKGFRGLESKLAESDDVIMQFDQRLAQMVATFELPENNKIDFQDYLAIEQCYVTDADFEEKTSRLVLGEDLKNTMLKIFYTHPSTVFSLLENTPRKTSKNIIAALNDGVDKLEKISLDLNLLDNIEIYFPKNNNPNHERFMLISTPQQALLFENILSLKRTMMEVNKTLKAIPADDLEHIKKTINKRIIALAKPVEKALEKIEGALAKLDVDESSNAFRKVYQDLFSGFAKGGPLDERLKKARFSDLMLLLDEVHLSAFAKKIKGDLKGGLLTGVLKEFVELYGVDDIELISVDKKVKLFQIAFSASGDDLLALEDLKKRHLKYCKNQRVKFDWSTLKKLNGEDYADEDDFLNYIKNNEYLYNAERKLVDQKRGVLLEMQKALALSVPEMMATVDVNPEDKKLKGFWRLVKNKKVEEYGIPYNPAMSLSLDYILNLFKPVRDAIKVVKHKLGTFSLSETTSRSFSLSLSEMLEQVGNKNIPSSIENALIVINKIRGDRASSFDSLYGALSKRIKKESEVLEQDNQAQVIVVMKALKSFLDTIPDDFKQYSFLELNEKIKGILKKMKDLEHTLSVELKGFDPHNSNQVEALKVTIGQLNVMKKTFEKFKPLIDGPEFKDLVMNLPKGFPYQLKLLDFVESFQVPLIENLNKMDANLKNMQEVVAAKNLTQVLEGMQNKDPESLQLKRKADKVRRSAEPKFTPSPEVLPGFLQSQSSKKDKSVKNPHLKHKPKEK